MTGEVSAKSDFEREDETVKETTAGEKRKRLEISDLAVEDIIQDVLSGAGGIKDIFGTEQVAGIFDSSVAAQAAGDFAAQVTGEIARLRAEEVATDESKSKTKRHKTDVSASAGAEAGFSFF